MPLPAICSETSKRDASSIRRGSDTGKASNSRTIARSASQSAAASLRRASRMVGLHADYRSTER